MTLEVLENELKSGKLNSIYLLYGEEKYLLETTIKKIKKIFGDCIQGINYVQIDETNLNNLIQDIQTPSFGYEKKLIIIKANLLKSNLRKSEENQEQNTISKYIEENIKEIKESTILIFVEETAEKNNLYKIIEKYGEIVDFEKLKPNDIIKKLKIICNAYKVNIDEKTLQYFIETCGTSMQILINEIRKLIEYTGENGTITKQTIDKLSIKELESRIFDLTDNLGKKDTKKALEILQELVYNKEPVQKILITLYNHFKKLYLIKLSEKYKEDLTNTLKLKPNQMFLITKYKKQSGYFKENELRKILLELINLDNKSKIR